MDRVDLATVIGRVEIWEANLGGSFRGKLFPSLLRSILPDAIGRRLVR